MGRPWAESQSLKLFHSEGRFWILSCRYPGTVVRGLWYEEGKRLFNLKVVRGPLDGVDLQALCSAATRLVRKRDAEIEEQLALGARCRRLLGITLPGEDTKTMHAPRAAHAPKIARAARPAPPLQLELAA